MIAGTIRVIQSNRYAMKPEQLVIYQSLHRWYPGKPTQGDTQQQDNENIQRQPIGKSHIYHFPSYSSKRSPAASLFSRYWHAECDIPRGKFKDTIYGETRVFDFPGLKVRPHYLQAPRLRRSGSV
jgi:hypothetical protein